MPSELGNQHALLLKAEQKIKRELAVARMRNDELTIATKKAELEKSFADRQAIRQQINGGVRPKF
jgi:hypothetical protein